MFRVQCSGFRFQSAEFRIQGSGLRVQGSDFRVQRGSGVRENRFFDKADASIENMCWTVIHETVLEQVDILALTGPLRSGGGCG